MKISRDQNTVKLDGKTYVAKYLGNDQSCNHCDFLDSDPEVCVAVPCCTTQWLKRKDGKKVVFKEVKI